MALKSLGFFSLSSKCTSYFMHEHKDMIKSKSGMCRHGISHPDDHGYKHKYGIYTRDGSLCVYSCLSISVHCPKFLKENKELAPVILIFLYRNTLSLSGKCFSLNNRVTDPYNFNWLSSVFIRNYSAGWHLLQGKKINTSVLKLNHVKGKKYWN